MSVTPVTLSRENDSVSNEKPLGSVAACSLEWYQGEQPHRMLPWSPLPSENSTSYFGEGKCALRTNVEQDLPPMGAGDAGPASAAGG